jgi:hypothetical protein
MKSLIRSIAESSHTSSSNPGDFVSDEPPTNSEIEPDLTDEPRNSS